MLGISDGMALPHVGQKIMLNRDMYAADKSKVIGEKGHESDIRGKGHRQKDRV